MSKRFLFAAAAVVWLHTTAIAQDDDLLNLLETEQTETDQVEATFKGTRLINGHSVETRDKGVLDFIISHRFGTINSGAYELFGLDGATIRLGLEYAINDRLYVGLGRSSFEKTYDTFAKYRILRQSAGSSAMPISVTWVSTAMLKTLRTTPELEFNQKIAYTHQALIARKFGPKLSLQVMPTWVHYNFIAATDDYNDVYAVGVGGRYKFTSRLAVNTEYYHQLQTLNGLTKNAFAIGVDIDTGGHIFQLQFTNATSMVPKGFIGETTNDFFGGDIHFGFNISRTFQVN